MSKRAANAIETVVGWMDAMRQGDPQAIAGWFHPQVTWRGVPDDAICRNRDDVLEMLRDSLVPCPEDPQTYELDAGLRGAVAVELIAAGDETVVLGAKVPGLSEVGGTEPSASALQRLSRPRRPNRRGHRLRPSRTGAGGSRRGGAEVALAPSATDSARRPISRAASLLSGSGRNP